MSSICSDSFGSESFQNDNSHEEHIINGMIEELIQIQQKENPDKELTRFDEIDVSVTLCKKKLLEQSPDITDGMRRVFVSKIVQFGLEKQNLEDPDTSFKDEMRSCNGHEFALQSSTGRNPCCEICMSTIWRLLQAWRRCKLCGLRAHDKCVYEVRRECASVKGLDTEFQYPIKICDERGLAEQDYSCFECREPLSFEAAAISEPRLCGLTGRFFCPNCHWNDEWPIPARLIHNMDPTPYPISRAAKQLLAVTHHKPLINMNELNPMMFKFHSALNKVQKMRRDFLIMKCYFVSCRNARKLRILQYLREHQHFVEDSEIYTLDELKQIASGSLVRELEDIHTVFRAHIEDECETCKGNGFFCELCENPKDRDQILFPFTDGIAMCSTCLFVFHGHCFDRKGRNCPRCLRRQKRQQKNIH